MNIFDAIQNNELIFLKELIKSGVNLDIKNKYGHTAISYAIHYGYFEIVKELLNAGVNINTTYEDEMNVLSIASYVGGSYIVKLILQQMSLKGFSFNIDAFDKEGFTVLMSERRNIENVRELIKFGANINLRSKQQGNTVLHMASTLEVVKELVKSGADIYAKNNYGESVIDVISYGYYNFYNEVDKIKEFLDEQMIQDIIKILPLSIDIVRYIMKF